VELKWKKFEDDVPVCNSDILVTDFNDIWIHYSMEDMYYQEYIEDKTKTYRWIDLIDFKPAYEYAVKNIPLRCDHTCD
jgi:hypothetical protein